MTDVLVFRVMNGFNGWTPELAIVVDGDRCVQQVVSWIGGTGNSPEPGLYVGADGFVTDIADAVDIRGLQGNQGAQGPQGDTGAQGPAGENGTNGNDGWTPVFADVADGSRIVQQISDWVGGTGIKPETGLYVGSSGLVSNIADAVNIRGPQGATGNTGDTGPQGPQGDPGPGVASGGIVTQRLKKASSTNYDTVWTDEDVAHIDDYGAVGDGVTNDTVAMQSAIATGKQVSFNSSKKYIIDLFNTDGLPLQNIDGTPRTNNTFWTRDVLPIEPYILNQLRYMPSHLSNIAADTTPDMDFIGNSIMQGTGTSAYGYTMMAQLQFRLRDYFNRGSYANWGVADLGIGGTLTNTALMMLADNSDYTQNARTSTSEITFTITLRNDVELGDLQDFATAFESLIVQCIKKRKDLVLITDPPKINVTTGDIEDGQTFEMFYDVAMGLCGQYGVCVVDAWRYFRDFNRIFGLDLRSWMFDALHPNNYGHLIMSDMVFAMLTRIRNEAVPIGQNSYGSNFIECYNNFTATSGSTIDTGASGTSVRRKILGESTVQAYSLTNGQSLSFTCPQAFTGYYIELAPGSSGSTTYSVTYGSSSVATNQPGGNSNVNGLVKTFRTISSLGTWKKRQNLTITCSAPGAQTLLITGVGFICPAQVSRYDIPTGVQTGTWTTGTLSGGDAETQSATVGDTYQFEFTGNSLIWRHSTGSAFGKFSYSIDGAAAVTVDCYVASGESQTEKVVEVGEGQHNVIFTIVTKNASASANTVKLGGFRLYTQKPMQRHLMHIASGTTTPIRQFNYVRPYRPATGVYSGYDGTNIVASAAMCVETGF